MAHIYGNLHKLLYQLHIIHTCPRGYSRTTAEGRRRWDAIYKLRDAVKTLDGKIQESLDTGSPWPDISPSIMAAFHLKNVLCVPSRPGMILPHIELNEGTAVFTKYLACVTYSGLCKIHELDCMSVRTIPLTGPRADKLRRDILELQYTIVTFITLADALHTIAHQYITCICMYYPYQEPFAKRL